jgi:hypothetical protein
VNTDKAYFLEENLGVLHAPHSHAAGQMVHAKIFLMGNSATVFHMLVSDVQMVRAQ